MKKCRNSPPGLRGRRRRPPEPTPAERVLTARTDVDSALTDVVNGAADTASAAQRVTGLRSDLADAEAQLDAQEAVRLDRIRRLHGAIDVSIETLESLKEAHPLPEAPQG